MTTEPELLNERLERLAMVLDEIMPNCALLVRDALELLKEQQQQIWELQDQVEYLTDKLKEQEAVLAHWDDDTGHWIEGDRNGIDPHARTTGEMIDTFRCSWCGFYQYWKTPFCPNCGAKMEGR